MTKRDKVKSLKGLVRFKNWQLITQRSSLQEEIIVFRKRWQIPPQGYVEYTTANEWTFAQMKKGQYGSFVDDASSTFSKYYKDKDWILFIITYILTNEAVSELKDLEGEGFSNWPKIKNVNHKKETITITITANTQLNDLNRFFQKEVRDIQKTMSSYERPRKRSALLSHLVMADKPIGKTYQEQYQDLPDKLIKSKRKLRNLDSLERGARRVKRELQADNKK